MAEQKAEQSRMVQLVINIVIDAVPLDAVNALKEQAYQLGDEWGARVNVNETPTRTVTP